MRTSGGLRQNDTPLLAIARELTTVSAAKAASGAITYAAGRVLRLVCSGNDVSVYYNGAQVGSTVTVADAGIVSNVNHGKFSTYASNVLANYVAA